QRTRPPHPAPHGPGSPPHRPPYQRPILGLFHHRPGPSPALPQPARSEPVRHVLAHAPGHRVDEEPLAYALAHHQNGRRYTLVRREHAPRIGPAGPPGLAATTPRPRPCWPRNTHLTTPPPRLHTTRGRPSCGWLPNP